MLLRLVLLGLLGLSAWGQLVPFRSRSVRKSVTFNNQIVRIFQENCQVCHHPGDIGPFSMMTYRDVSPYARSIKQETQARRMPPWKPVQGYGEFIGERRLTQQQIDLIAQWVDSGAPEGDPRDLPEPLEFSPDWTLGTPDLVLEPDAPFTLEAEGNDVYRCFSMPTGLLENRNVSAVEVRPGNRGVVHHVILFQDSLGLSSRLRADDSQPGYNCFGGPGFLPTGAFGGWVPGNRPRFLPDRMGIRTTAGDRVVMQVHYHRKGATVQDRTRVGIYFARTPVDRYYTFLPILNDRFVLPAGDPSRTVTASLTLPPFINLRGISIIPHMHLLGKQIRVDAVYPGGDRRPLIFIDDWNFDWQDTYFFRNPVPLPALTRLELTSIYDNSASNPRNPNDPPKDVRWGEQTTDEMCLAFIGVTLE